MFIGSQGWSLLLPLGWEPTSVGGRLMVTGNERGLRHVDQEIDRSRDGGVHRYRLRER